MKIARNLALGLLALLVAGLLLPERIRIPVAGASARDWNPKSFWFEPWGTSGVHKSLFKVFLELHKRLAGMGCKARCAANSPAIGKRRNAADRPARHLPEGLE
jgi:hypothetical protein